MKKETDLISIKKTAKAFLYLPIDETEYGPIFLVHPFFDSCYQAVRDGDSIIMVDITKSDEDLNTVRKQFEDLIDKADNAWHVCCLLRKPYWLTFFYHTKGFLSKEDYSKILGDVWVESENPNGDANVKPLQSASMFRKADKEILMTPEELAVYNALPKKCTVYRGVGISRQEKGLSWTRSKKKANWFAHRFDNETKKGYILKGKIEKEKVLAYLNRRDEDEIVCSYKDIEEMEVI